MNTQEKRWEVKGVVTFEVTTSVSEQIADNILDQFTDELDALPTEVPFNELKVDNVTVLILQHFREVVQSSTIEGAIAIAKTRHHESSLPGMSGVQVASVEITAAKMVSDEAGCCDG